MRTRIARSIVAVTALVIVILGIPLAIIIQRFYESRATVELQRSAALAVAELTVPLDAAEIAAAASEPDAPDEFSVYGEDGGRLYGPGPATLPAADPDQIIVVSPITDRRSEAVVGSVLVTRQRSEIAADARQAWALMALAALAGIALAVLIARREATRLAAPITDLADRADQLGSGGFATGGCPTGIPEIDTLSDALNASDQRLAEALAREREFSANASHQLRTPLASLRLGLERGDIETAEREAGRLQQTVEHLLDLSRGALRSARATDIEQLVRDAERRWHPVFERDGRTMTATVAAHLPAGQVRQTSIEQVLDIVLDNSLQHGAGTTRIDALPAPGGLVVAISDDGPGIAAVQQDTVFQRHRGSGHGIGLALARTLIEADGGRLLLADPARAEFRIVLLAEPAEPGLGLSGRP
ncbi:MAG: HAMP domain-containing histidine kinase [Acidimicrobiales bacterium]|nr:HAMP domain-containing histidine kinase [Acidimicrobiales bacterium]